MKRSMLFLILAACADEPKTPVKQNGAAQTNGSYGYGQNYGPQQNYAPNTNYAPNNNYGPSPTYGGPVNTGAATTGGPIATNNPPNNTGPIVTTAPAMTPPVVPTAAPAQGRPLMTPLLAAQWQREVTAVAAELISHLDATSQARVKNIPFTFDPDPAEINAFAGCDDKGQPFMATTQGLMEAMDAISQTIATDELYRTKTYETYLNTVVPPLATTKGARAALPANLIPLQYIALPERLSRAHEIFDEITAFTFGHELAHHYLGHTGCANGQATTGAPSAANLARVITTILPGLNQLNESAADRAGCVNVLDTGRARLPNYRWSERGGLILFGFFYRMEREAGIGAFNPVGFLQTHPNPALRQPYIQSIASDWYRAHPDVKP